MISRYTTSVATGDARMDAIVSWLGFDNSDRPKAEHEANAALIARASELLEENAKLRELLRESLIVLVSLQTCDPIIDRIKAAIGEGE